MPLVLPDLVVQVQAAMEQMPSLPNQRASAQLWAPIFVRYVGSVSTAPPTPARPAAIAAAESAMVELLAASTFASGATDLQNGLAGAAAAVVGSSLLPATPPPAPFVPGGSLVSTPDAALALAASLDAWVRTGTATAPASPPVPWA